MSLRHAATLRADPLTDQHANERPAREIPSGGPETASAKREDATRDGEQAGPREASRPAFRAVYAEFFRAMWRTLRRLGVEPAQLDDAVQDVFVVVHRRLPEFDGRAVRGWLYAIAVRVASDYRRGAAHRRTVPLNESLADPAPDPARARELGEAVRLLHELLAELDEPKRTVFVLGELEELTAPEIAEALGENVNTVYARLRAARAHFDAAFRRRRERDEWRVR